MDGDLEVAEIDLMRRALGLAHNSGGPIYRNFVDCDPGSAEAIIGASLVAKGLAYVVASNRTIFLLVLTPPGVALAMKPCAMKYGHFDDNGYCVRCQRDPIAIPCTLGTI